MNGEARMSTRTLRSALGAVALAACLVPGRAGAEDGVRVSVRWGKLADLLHDGAWLFPRESWPGLLERKTASGSGVEPRRYGVSPHLSLVARDWGGAQLIVGHLMLTDEVRLSRSSRMVLTRVRIAEGRLMPFVQAGLGQWRVDTDWMPVLPRDVELAGQLGGGFELGIGRGALVALEADYTILYREQHEPQMVSAPHLWGTFFAARVPF
jgi:hypothetical protein